MRLEQWLYTLPLRLRSLARRGEADRELDEELQNHIEERTSHYVDAGLAPGEARSAALREWRGVDQIKEECRDMRKVNLIRDLGEDIRYGLRQLRRSPGFAAVVVLSLALGIGANTAIFSLMDAVLFEMLPVKQPRELMLLKWSAKGWPSVVEDLEGSSIVDNRTGLSWSESLSYPVYDRLRDHNHVFAQTFAFASNTGPVNVSMNGQAEAAIALMVSGNYFAGLGVNPLHGRTILPSDDVASAPPVVVLSHRFWQRRFGADVSVVGKALAVNGTSFTVAGVAPAEFFGLEPGEAPDLFVALSQYPNLLPEYSAAAQAGGGQAPTPLMTDSKTWWLEVVGRLLPGVTQARAQAELSVLFDQTLGPSKAAADPKRPALSLGPGSQGLDGLRRTYSQPLRILMAMVGLVLLIACANVVGLLLARATIRQRELAVRLSLGAGRGRLVRQLLTESMLLALAGGAAGLLLARWAGIVLLALLSSGRSPVVLALHLDVRILAFTVGVSLLTGIVFGLAPALRATRVNLAPSLKEGSSAARQSTRFRAGRILVAAQMALCLLLLVGAGLFLRTLGKLENVDLGFQRDHLLRFAVQPGANGYQGARLANYYQELQRRIQSIPGVRSVGMSGHAPVGDGVSTTTAAIPGYTDGTKRVEVYRNEVAPGFFEAVGIPLVLGRFIGPHDVQGSTKVALINEKFVKDYFHGDNPVGRVLEFGDEKHPRVYQIVGVVRNAKYNRVREDVPPTAYVSYLQETNIRSYLCYEIRSAADPKGLIPAVRQQALALDKDVPLADIKTEAEAISETLVQERIFARLASVFGGLALALACVGLYGIMAYAVACRTNEIGIRMAVGARPGDILSMVLRESVRVVLTGAAVGMAAALVATRVISSLLYGLTPRDPLTLAAAALVLLAVTLVAASIPAWRASRVDPLVALRNE